MVPTIDSTNAELLRLPVEQAPPGSALLALSQTGGRGRSERVWESPPGGMYLSVVLLPREPQGLALLGAWALLRLLQEFGLSPRLRWPNDVMVGGKKIGGVLPVARYQGNRLERAILGVGLNVAQEAVAFPEELRSQLTTLAREATESVPSVPTLAHRYLDTLALEMERMEETGLSALCLTCQPYLEGVGEPGRLAVLVEPGQPPRILGEVAGLAGDGALLLKSGQSLATLGRQERLRFSDE